MDKRIQAFIEAEKNLTFCTVRDNAPHCVSCFYAFTAEDNLLVFKSERKTQHIVNALLNNRVAGTLVPYRPKPGIIKGIQFTGKFTVLMQDMLERAKRKYYSKFPVALGMSGELWAIELLSVKMIDNTLGFGKKIIWEKPISEERISKRARIGS